MAGLGSGGGILRDLAQGGHARGRGGRSSGEGAEDYLCGEVIGHAARPLDLVLPEAVVLAPPEVEFFLIALHVGAVNEVLGEGSDDLEAGGEAGCLDDADVGAGEDELVRVVIDGAGVVEQVEGDHLHHKAAEDGGRHEDDATPFEGFLGHGGIDGGDAGVGAGTAGDVDVHDGGVVVELVDESVDEGAAAVCDGLAQPDLGLDGLVHLLDEGVDDVLLIGQIVVACIDADEVLGVFADEGLRADLAVHLVEGDGDEALGEGDGVLGVKSAGAAVLDDGSEGKVVQMHRTLDAGLDADAATGVAVCETEGADDEVAVLLHIGGEAGHVEICYSRHSCVILIWLVNS